MNYPRRSRNNRRWSRRLRNYRSLRLSDFHDLTLLLFLRRRRGGVNRSAPEPGVTCTVKEGNNRFEFGNGVIGYLRAVDVVVFVGAVREDTDQMLHAL